MYALLGERQAPVSLNGTTLQHPINAASPNYSVYLIP